MAPAEATRVVTPTCEVNMLCRWLATLVLVLAAVTAAAQVTVREYPLPPRLHVHDA